MGVAEVLAPAGGVAAGVAAPGLAGVGPLVTDGGLVGVAELLAPAGGVAADEEARPVDGLALPGVRRRRI